jgi:hypothetical protein
MRLSQTRTVTIRNARQPKGFAALHVALPAAMVI